MTPLLSSPINRGGNYIGGLDTNSLHSLSKKGSENFRVLFSIF
jgi:hypothetical protein